MAERIPPGRTDEVAGAAHDARCAEIERIAGTPPQTRWANVPERIKAGFRAKVTKVDQSADARTSTATTAAIAKAIDDAARAAGR